MKSKESFETFPELMEKFVFKKCLGRFDWQAQTQGISKSTAVAAGSERLAWKMYSDYHSCCTDLAGESRNF